MDARELLSGSPYVVRHGFEVLESEDGRAVVATTVQEHDTNSRGIAHGGVVAALADTAGGAAIARQPSVRGAPVATVSMTLNYNLPARVGDRLTATGTRTNRGRRVVTCEVSVTNQDDELVASALMTLATTGKPTS